MSSHTPVFTGPNNQQFDELNISNFQYKKLIDNFSASVDNEKCSLGALNSHILDEAIEDIHGTEDNLERYQKALIESSRNDNDFDSFYIDQWFHKL